MIAKRHIYIVLLGAILGVMSCKSIKDVGVVGRAELVSKKDLLKSIHSDRRTYKTVEIKKFIADFKNGSESSSFKGYVRYEADKVVMASIAPALGIEMFRLLGAPDTLAFIDRYNKQYYSGTYDFLKQRLGVDMNFDLLQFVLSGNISCLPADLIPDKNFNFAQNNQFSTLSKTIETENSKTLVEYSFDNNLLLKRIYIKDFSRGNFMEVFYNDHFIENKRTFPSEIVINGNKGHQLMAFEIRFKNIEFDKELNFPFSVSSKYTKVNM